MTLLNKSGFSIRRKITVNNTSKNTQVTFVICYGRIYIRGELEFDFFFSIINNFSFSIEKSDAVWQEEADSVKAAFAPYFSRNAGITESALADFDRFYNDSLKKLVWDESYRILRRRLEKVYNDGVISASDEDILSDKELFRVYEGNTSGRAIFPSGFFL